MYLEALIDQAKKEQSQDEALAPHLIEEAAQKQKAALDHAAAYKKLTPEQMLELGYRLYG